MIKWFAEKYINKERILKYENKKIWNTYWIFLSYTIVSCAILSGLIMPFFSFLIRWIELEDFNRPGPELCFFFSEIGLEVTFRTTRQNRKPQTASSAIQIIFTGCLIFCRCEIASNFSNLFLVLSASCNILIYCWKDEKFRQEKKHAPAG